MIVYLMRHGAAEAQATSDAARELTRQGVMDNRAVLAKLKMYSPPLDRAFTSPYQRARQTSSVLRTDFPTLRCEVNTALEPESNVYDVLDLIEQSAANQLFIVSHNPLLSKLLGLMLDGTLETHRHMGTSHIACVSFDVVAPGCGELLYTLTP